MSMFKGCGVALVTPFNENGINFDELGRLIDYVIDGGVNAIFVCGTTGEPSTMTLAERESVIEFAVSKANKRVPVFAGSGGNNTADAIEFSKRCAYLGADGLLVVTPYYNKCTQNGCIAHYKAIAESVNLPIIAYNVPSRTGFNLTPISAVKLADVKGIVAIKEASGNMDQITETLRLTNGKLAIYSGDDALTVPCMSIGAHGVISVVSNVVPHKVSEITSLCLKADFINATKKYFEIAPLVKALFSEVNPIPCKKALEFLGFNVGAPRMPLSVMEQDNAQKLLSEMQKLKLVK